MPNNTSLMIIQVSSSHFQNITLKQAIFSLFRQNWPVQGTVLAGIAPHTSHILYRKVMNPSQRFQNNRTKNPKVCPERAMMIWQDPSISTQLTTDHVTMVSIDAKMCLYNTYCTPVTSQYHHFHGKMSKNALEVRTEISLFRQLYLLL